MQENINREVLSEKEKNELNSVISDLILKSRDNYEEISAMILEYFSSLSAGRERLEHLESQKFFNRLFHNLTGENSNIRNSIARDQNLAAEAMGTFIEGVLLECRNNQQLTLAIYENLNANIQENQKMMKEVGQDIIKMRQAIVALAQEKPKAASTECCPVCGEDIPSDRYLCPRCSTLLPAAECLVTDVRDQLKTLEHIMQREMVWSSNKSSWSRNAEMYADLLQREKEIAVLLDVLPDDSLPNREISDAIMECRNAKFQIALVGDLKAGKSTLLNTLLGADLAAVGGLSTTAAVTKFCAAKGKSYVTVSFYSEKEWKQREEEAGKQGDAALLNKLQTAASCAMGKQWIGAEAETKDFENLEDMQKFIERWSSAGAKEHGHMYVSEIEVGVQKQYFHLPEEIVLVDTPGLNDVATDRSDVTKHYIESADAVLLALRLQALTVEKLSMICTALNSTQGQKNKVFLVGTQKDNIFGSQCVDEIISGEEGWTSWLLSTGHYRSKREVEAQIFPVSSLQQRLLDIAMDLKQEELSDPDKLSDEDYNMLKQGFQRALKRRDYPLTQIHEESKDCLKTVREYFGIEKLKTAIYTRLLTKMRKEKMDHIQTAYNSCRCKLLSVTEAEVKRLERERQDLHAGAEELQKELTYIQQEKDKLNQQKQAIEDNLNMLRSKITPSVVRKGEA